MLFKGRFSKEANQVIINAYEIAKSFEHDFVGSEHILLGLMKQDSSVITKLNSKYSYEYVYNIILDIFNILPSTNTNFELTGVVRFTEEGDHIVREAYNLQKMYRLSALTVDCLWLAIINEKSSNAYLILERLNLDIDKINKFITAQIDDTDESDDFEGEEPQRKFSLEQYTVDITKKAIQGEIDPIIGRVKEQNRIIQILSRKSKNNPVLIGEPGVGKTAIVEGLALQIVKNCVPDFLIGKKILSLDLASMVAGSKYRGEFEERLKKLIKEVQSRKDIILFCDELHTIVGAGSSEGTLDAANILKPSLSRGDIQIIGATTLEEYRKYFEKDKALDRRFQTIIVEEPSDEECHDILLGIKNTYEKHHGIKIDNSALAETIKLSKRYIRDKRLPDKAINLLDEAASKISMDYKLLDDSIKNIIYDINVMQEKKQQYINSDKFEKAAEIRDEINLLKSKLEDYKKEKAQKLKRKILNTNDIVNTISILTGINADRLTRAESLKIANLENELKKKIKGQDEAISIISKAIKRSRAGLSDPDKPIGTFMFLGPTGVGKTELCKVLSQVVFDSENSMYRIDMSEYMEKHSVAKLIGSPPGYVGYKEGGQLTNFVKTKPYSLILLDEIEKAHPDVFNILLQVLDDGVLTDSEGNKIDFRNTIIIMTSNVGAQNIALDKVMGFGKGSVDEYGYSEKKSDVMKAVKETFKPEFINRIDEIVVFNELSKNSLKEIIKLILNEPVERILEQGISLTYSNAVVDFILNKGYSKQYGARPLKRVVQSNIIDKLSEDIINGKLQKKNSVKISVKDKELIFNYV